MPLPLIGMAIGAGAGLLQGELGREHQNDQFMLKARTAKWSPYTKINPESIAVDNSTSMDKMMQGAQTGGEMQQNLASADAANAMNQKKMDAYDSQMALNRAQAQALQQGGIAPTGNGGIGSPKAKGPSGNTAYSPWLGVDPTLYGVG